MMPADIRQFVDYSEMHSSLVAKIKNFYLGLKGSGAMLSLITSEQLSTMLHNVMMSPLTPYRFFN